MKASELVERLNKLIKSYGDQEVVHDNGIVYSSIDDIEFEPDHRRLGQLTPSFVIS